MKNLRSILAAVVLIAGVSTNAWAHHSRSNFDLDTVLEFHGVITEYSWRNPHTFATLAVQDDAGESKELLLELNSVSVLTRQGWTRDTLSVGDEVTVFANPDHDGDKKHAPEDGQHEKAPWAKARIDGKSSSSLAGIHGLPPCSSPTKGDMRSGSPMRNSILRDSW